MFLKKKRSSVKVRKKGDTSVTYIDPGTISLRDSLIYYLSAKQKDVMRSVCLKY